VQHYETECGVGVRLHQEDHNSMDQEREEESEEEEDSHKSDKVNVK